MSKWDTVRLGDVVTLLNGRAYKQNELLNTGKYPVLRVGNFFSNRDWYYSDLELEEDKYCDNGDLLFAWSASFGPKIWDGEKVIYHYHIWKILTTDRIRKDFLYYYLDNVAERVKAEGHGITMIHTTKAEMEERIIPIPPLETQRQIATNLDKVTHTIDLCNAILEKLDLLVKSRFVEMFGDNKYSLIAVEDVCSEIVDCPHTTPKYDGILKNPAIRTSEIKKGYITWDTMKYVSDDEYEDRIKRLKPEHGDIVYGREGTFGNAAVLPKGHRFCLGQRVMLLRPDYNKFTSEYILYAIISDDVYRQAVKTNNASTVAHVNVKDVKKFMIPYPPLNLQQQFAAFVEQTDKSKLAVKQVLEKAETLKKALMQEYFG